jgi:uncharacterized protein YunC (DUF1805 family)
MIDPVPFERLYDIALGIAEGRVFHSGMLECPEEAGCVFTPLVLMHESQLAALMADEPALIWEWTEKKVGDEAGMPVFLSCNYLNKADAETVLAWAKHVAGEDDFDRFLKANAETLMKLKAADAAIPRTPEEEAYSAALQTEINRGDERQHPS